MVDGKSYSSSRKKIMIIKQFNISDYEDLVNFLIEINKEDKTHINWNWARLEWMIGHPYFDKSLISHIALWIDEDHVVGAAIFDMYLGEASVLTLKGYEYLYPEILDYAYKNLKDDNGLGIAVNEKDVDLIKLVKDKGYLLTPQKEVLLKIDLDKEYSYSLNKDISVKSVDPYLDTEKIEWIFYQGFGHGDDYEAFKSSRNIDTYKRPHANKELSLVAANSKGEYVGFCSLWYDSRTNYAYLEPLCVIPAYRKQGIARALIHELFNRVKVMGAKEVYVISDMEFYKKLGFKEAETYSFYFIDKVEEVNGHRYLLKKLLGKGKGGYSYLASDEDKEVVLKKIHHEPCSYYQFGNKIEAEINDYKRLTDAGIRIPKMIEVDKEQEIIIKEYIKGEVVFDLVKEDRLDDKYIIQVEEMADLAREKGLNIDYFPTNFVIQNEKLYYIDYECNSYMEEWNYSNWGKKYWSKTKEFLDYLDNSI